MWSKKSSPIGVPVLSNLEYVSMKKTPPPRHHYDLWEYNYINTTDIVRMLHVRNTYWSDHGVTTVWSRANFLVISCIIPVILRGVVVIHRSARKSLQPLNRKTYWQDAVGLWRTTRVVMVNQTVKPVLKQFDNRWRCEIRHRVWWSSGASPLPTTNTVTWLQVTSCLLSMLFIHYSFFLCVCSGLGSSPFCHLNLFITTSINNDHHSYNIHQKQTTLYNVFLFPWTWPPILSVYCTCVIRTDPTTG